MIVKVISFVLLNLVLTPLCGAWESERGVFPSPLVATSPERIKISAVYILLGEKETKLRYLINGKEGDEKPQNLTIYSQLFSWGGVGAEYPDRHFPEISMVVDGRPIKRISHLFAIHGGENITEVLKKANLNLGLVGYGEEAIINIRSGKEFKGLKSLFKKNVIKKIGNMALPGWKVFASHSWEIEIAKQKISEIELKFKTRPTFKLLNKLSPMDKGVLYSHCAPSSFVENLPKETGGNYILREYQINFDVENLNLDQADVDIGEIVKSKEKDIYYFYCNSESEGQAESYENGRLGAIKAANGVFSLVSLEVL